MPAPRRLLIWALPALALAVGACGSHGGQRAQPTPRATTTAGAGAGGGAGAPRRVTSAEAAVIRGWSSSLRHGDVGRAARYFALPSVVSNGTPLLKMTTRAQARAFNRALPCGAEVVALERRVHEFVVATFRLTERPGPGECGSGTGALARTAFLIRSGHIVQWLRVPDAPGTGSQNQS
jgi:hypothetical protein